jgi:hypothetical protein
LVIWNWVKQQGDLTWGGEWGKSDPQNGNIKSLYCDGISKNVFLITTDDFEGKYKLTWNGYLPNNDITYKGNGKYSIKEILDLAGITDYEYKKEIKNE